MKQLFIMLPAFAMAIVVSSCKTDSEDDYLAYLESLNDTIDDSQSTDIDDDTNYVVLNEICGKDNPDDDWVEIYNGSESTAQIGNWYLVKTDEDGLSETIFTFAEDADIEPNGYIVVATLTGELQAGISHKKQVGIALYSAEDELIDAFDRDADIGVDMQHSEGGSYARKPNGTGAWTICETNSRGAVND